MRILIAPDKFKGSLTSQQVCDAIALGIQNSLSDVENIKKPMADGGEGSIDLLQKIFFLREAVVTVQDPIGRQISARYYHNDHHAYIEMSSASGLDKLEIQERNPMITSTFGTGQLIFHALQKGMREISLFVGGSATNDAGIGMAAALGYRFLNKNGDPVEPNGRSLGLIQKIDTSTIINEIGECKFSVICDVENPLFGPHGAAEVYAKQKGANDEQVHLLDHGLIHISEIIKHDLHIDISDLSGAGAAGGLGGGAVAFLGAEIVKGIDHMMAVIGLENEMRSTDFVITGEGKIDKQTAYGKVVAGVARLAKKYHKPCFAVCGVSELSLSEANSIGLNQIYSILDLGISESDALHHAEVHLEKIMHKFCYDLKKYIEYQNFRKTGL